MKMTTQPCMYFPTIKDHEHMSLILSREKKSTHKWYHPAYAVVTPLRITTLGILGDTWLTRGQTRHQRVCGSYGVYVTRSGNSAT